MLIITKHKGYLHLGESNRSDHDKKKKKTS